jgi:hypothetical protein
MTLAARRGQGGDGRLRAAVEQDAMVPGRGGGCFARIGKPDRLRPAHRRDDGCGALNQRRVCLCGSSGELDCVHGSVCP